MNSSEPPPPPKEPLSPPRCGEKGPCGGDHNVPLTVNLLELAVSAVASSIIASRPIRKLSRQCNSCQTYDKSATVDSKNARIKLDGTIVTDADGAAQRIICASLRNVSRAVRIIGEESRQEVEDASRELDYRARATLSPRSNRRVMTKEAEEEEKIYFLARKEVFDRFFGVENVVHGGKEIEVEVDASRISVFVDPLDGTSCYAKGDYEAVTILVGIIVDNTPIFGVICKPFGQEGQTTFLDSGCFTIYGGLLLRGAFVAGGEEMELSRIFQKRDSEKQMVKKECLINRKAIISKSRSGGVVRQCIDSLNSQGLLNKNPIFVAGAGYKTLRLILGTDDEALWFFPKPGTSLWDIAAADALLRSVGGRVSDKFGKDLDYSKSRKDAENSDGIVASNDITLHEKCIELFLAEQWCDS